MPHRPRMVFDQGGFTIVEVLLTVVVLGIGLLALSSAIPLAAYGIQEGNQLSTATFLANQRMEQARNAPWTVCPSLDKLGVSAAVTAAPDSSGVVTFPDESPLPAPYASYSRQVRIANVQGPATCPGGVLTGTMGLRQVTVTVSYRPMTGTGVAPATRAKSAILTMYIGQR